MGSDENIACECEDEVTLNGDIVIEYSHSNKLK